MTNKSVSKEIAYFIVNAKVKKSTKKIARRFLIDWIGSVIAGSTTKPIKSIQKTITELGGKDQATILFSSKKSNVALAAFTNAAAAHVIEMDDLDRGSISHPGSSIISAALAYAEFHNLDMDELLDAIVIGYEIMIRIGEALGTDHYQYWHTTGTAGTIGVAAAISRISKAGVHETLMAIGTAGTMTAGLWEFLNDGAMSKQLHPAKAAHDGILSTLLSKNGFTGATKIIEGNKGLFAAMSPKNNPSQILKKLTLALDKWKIENVSFKMYASCRHTHPAVEGALQIIKEESIQYTNIASVNVEIYSQALELLSKVKANSPYSAKFNLPFCIASAIIFGDLGPSRFTEKTIKDKKIISLSKKIKFSVNKSLDKEYPLKWPSNVSIQLKNKKIIKKLIYYPLGDPENPISNIDLKNKFLSLTKNRLNKKSENLVDKLLIESQDIKPRKLIKQITNLQR